MKKNRGFSIIEVLIACLLTATTAMLLLNTESKAVKSLRQIHYHTEAFILADGLLHYQCLRQNLKLACAYPTFLQKEISARLPNGKASWRCSNHHVKVFLSWRFGSLNRISLEKRCDSL